MHKTLISKLYFSFSLKQFSNELLVIDSNVLSSPVPCKVFMFAKTNETTKEGLVTFHNTHPVNESVAQSKLFMLKIKKSSPLSFPMKKN